MSIQIRKILCPIDFSQHAERVVEWAAHLAKEHGSEVLLLHAYHLPVEFQQLEGQPRCTLIGRPRTLLYGAPPHRQLRRILRHFEGV